MGGAREKVSVSREPGVRLRRDPPPIYVSLVIPVVVVGRQGGIMFVVPRLPLHSHKPFGFVEPSFNRPLAADVDKYEYHQQPIHKWHPNHLL